MKQQQTMRVGIIGIGVVGGAVRHGLSKLGHTVKAHDIALDTTIDDVLDTQLAYLCVPTPPAADNSCDTAITESVVADLVQRDYPGVIVIKSTIEPGTVAKLQKRYPQARIAHVPEFLRERVAIADFTDNHDLCIIGTDSDEDYELIKASHGHFPHAFCRMSPTEAELAKYFNNAYNAMLITFANNFYEICRQLDINYSVIKDAMVRRNHIFDKYLDCNENLRGFGGACLPKDTVALAKLCERLGLDARLFKAILEDNDRYETTV